MLLSGPVILKVWTTWGWSHDSQPDCKSLLSLLGWSTHNSMASVYINNQDLFSSKFLNQLKATEIGIHELKLGSSMNIIFFLRHLTAIQHWTRMKTPLPLLMITHILLETPQNSESVICCHYIQNFLKLLMIWITMIIPFELNITV